jgi:hypothetical protein
VKSFKSLILSFFIICIWAINSNASDLTCFDDTSEVELTVKPVDTVGVVVVFFVDGYDIDSCRYDSSVDSLDFRKTRSVMPEGAHALMDSNYSLSMINYFKDTSNGKHIIKGAGAPSALRWGR